MGIACGGRDVYCFRMIDENSRRERGDGVSREEVEVILRGMRAVFGEAGRTGLARVLAGSKAKTVKEEWKKNPSYGAFLERSQPEILEMIDWCLDEEYLRVEKRDGYPLLLYAERGLAIDVELAAREFLEEMRERGFFWTKEELLNVIPHRTLERVLELMKEEGVENWREVLETWHERGTRRMKGWIGELGKEGEI
ncbi:MAG: RQC domain-containing protein [Verrucomicrobiaceae bacterium]